MTPRSPVYFFFVTSGPGCGSMKTLGRSKHMLMWVRTSEDGGGEPTLKEGGRGLDTCKVLVHRGRLQHLVQVRLHCGDALFHVFIVVKIL